MNKTASGIYDFLVTKYRGLFLLGVSLVITGLLFSKVFISIGSFILLGNWLLEGKLISRLRAYINNRLAVAVSLLFILHLAGMFYSTDLAYGFKDLRVKIPLMLFPLIFSTSAPLKENEFRWLQYLFVLSVLASTLVSTSLWLFGSESYLSDKRNMSIFISHIRFSLMICLAVFISIYQYWKTNNAALKIAFISVVCWFPVFLVIMESFTGIIALSVTAVIFTFYRLLKMKKYKAAFLAVGIVLIAITSTGFYLNDLYQEFSRAQAWKDVPYRSFTVNGEPYMHPDQINPRPIRQNGYMVYKNIAWDEFINTWNERSRINFDSNALNGYPVKHIVFWYLTSKGLNKDEEAINSLSNEELQAIERGVSNYIYLNRPGLEARILQTYWELDQYKQGGDINGHSVTMRLEFWRTAFSIFKENWLAGVGTGDIKKAFAEQYEKNQSPLIPKWRLRSHNQYLSFSVAFGVLGLIIAFYAFLFPIFNHKGNSIYLVFTCIVLLSMLNEDTLETQTGVTFFAFFNAFYLFLKPRPAPSSR